MTLQIFLATVSMISLLPLVYSILSTILTFKRTLDGPNVQNCSCAKCLTRKDAYHLKQKKNNYNRRFLIKIVFAVLLGFVLYWSINEVQDKEFKIDFKNFDPYEILDVSYTADVKEIKRAFRKLARKYHPDKIDPKDRTEYQTKMFLRIVTAYEILTDPVKKSNFEKYGNPDGPSRMSYILPDFMLNQKYHFPIIFLFLFFILVFLPVFICKYLARGNNEYDEEGYSNTNKSIYYHYLNENILLRHVPFIVGASIEFNSTPLRGSEESELLNLFSMCKNFIPKIKEERIPVPSKKAITLLYAWLSRISLKEASLEKDCDLIIERTPDVLLRMYEFISLLVKARSYNKNIKKFGFICLKTIIEFSQCLHQQLWFDFSPFLQLPNVDPDNVKFLMRDKSGKKNNKTFRDFISQMDALEREEFLKPLKLKGEEIQEMELISKTFPYYELELKFYVEGLDDIVVNDLVTVEISIIRKNIHEDQEVGITHSCGFKGYFEERVGIFLTDLKESVLHGDSITVIKKEKTVVKLGFVPREVFFII